MADDWKRLNAEPDGFCRIYYRKGGRGGSLYCWQWEGRFGGWKFYSCSQDGEPSHEVTVPGQPAAPERGL